MKTNALEIERKFLLKSMPTQGAERFLAIEQYYIGSGDRMFRIRRTAEAADVRYDKTTKVRLRPGVYDETIEDIGRDEFFELAKSSDRVVRKDRYVIPDAGLKWEIDEFTTARLIVAEIELPSEGYDLRLPTWIQEILISEVTGDDAFLNYNLAVKLDA